MDYYDQIGDYINNALSEEERKAFELEMERDEQLKVAVENHGAAMDVVGSIFESEVRSVIEDESLKIGNEGVKVEEKDNGKGAKVKRMNWMRWAAAASVVFVLGWWGMNQLSDDNAKLYADTLVDTNWPINKGQDENEISQSISKYLSDMQEEAKSELKSYSTAEANFWLSEIYYNEMKFDSTLLYLPSIDKNMDKKRRDKINYLTVLSLYFSDDKKQAKDYFINLPADTDEFYLRHYAKLDF